MWIRGYAEHVVAWVGRLTIHRDPIYGIRSDFVKENLNTLLGDEVMASVRAVDPDQLRSSLQASGLRELAIDGVLARLDEVQTCGMITGEAWPGVINGARLRDGADVQLAKVHVTKGATK